MSDKDYYINGVDLLKVIYEISIITLFILLIL